MITLALFFVAAYRFFCLLFAYRFPLFCELAFS